MARPKLKAEDIAKVAAATFGTQAGSRFLVHLNDVFFKRLIYNPGMDSMEMVHNDGKRWMIHYINTLVEQGRDKKAAPQKAVTSEEDSPDA